MRKWEILWEIQDDPMVEISFEMRFNPNVLIHSRKLAWIANMIKYLIKKKRMGGWDYVGKEINGQDLRRQKHMDCAFLCFLQERRLVYLIWMVEI